MTNNIARKTQSQSYCPSVQKSRVIIDKCRHVIDQPQSILNPSLLPTCISNKFVHHFDTSQTLIAMRHNFGRNQSSSDYNMISNIKNPKMCLQRILVPLLRQHSHWYALRNLSNRQTHIYLTSPQPHLTTLHPQGDPAQPIKVSQNIDMSSASKPGHRGHGHSLRMVWPRKLVLWVKG